MDSLVTASARALAIGDPLGALKHVALRNDPSALALRGIAMAQLGEHARARELLKKAARGFGTHEKVARARCVVAEAEVALAMRDLAGSPRALDAAVHTLEAHADQANAWHARLIAARRLLLIGRLADAAQALSALDGARLSPSLHAVASLSAAELALRSLRTRDARAALARANDAAHRAGVPALIAEVAEMRSLLDRPAARRIAAGEEQPLRLDEIEALLASPRTLVLDACRRALVLGDEQRSLARRSILFTLAAGLAEAWPGEAPRESLIERAFRIRRPDETHRARLRVEIGRLRALLKPMAAIEATPDGFVLRPRGNAEVAMLAPPIEGEQAALLALLADGEAWSTSALALALGDSQRTVQRALVELEEQGQVRAIGQARARRWLAPPLSHFTTILLLPASLPLD